MTDLHIGSFDFEWGRDVPSNQGQISQSEATSGSLFGQTTASGCATIGDSELD